MLKRLPYLLARWSLRNPRRIAIVAVIFMALALPGLLRLELRTDGHALVPPDDSAVRLDAEIREHFGLRDPIVVLIESSHPDGIYNEQTLSTVKTISDRLQRLDGIGKGAVTSLATERRDRVYPGTLSFRPYLDPVPNSSKLMDILRSDIEAAQILYGTLVSRDGKATSILVGAPYVTAGEDRTALYRRIASIVEPLASVTDRITIVGAPVAEALLGTHVLEDLALLLPLALALITAFLWRGTRRVWCVALALAEVGACILATFGLMGWVGVPVYLTTAILPVILTTVGLADEIHVFWRHQRKLALAPPGTPHLEILDATYSEVARPICLTGLTTATGFLSFLWSSIPAVRYFGLFAALGVLLCMLWSLTVLPASLAALSPEKIGRRRATDSAAGEWIVRLLAPLLARPKELLIGVIVVTLLLGLGIPRLVVQDSWIDGFRRHSEFRQATDRANEQLLGTHLLQLHLTSDPPAADIPRVGDRSGPLLNPKLINAIGDLEAYVRRQPGVGGVLGTHSHLTTVAFLWLGRKPDSRQIPEAPGRLDLVYKRFELGRGEHRRREVVDDDLQRTMVTVFLKNANFRDTAQLMQAIRSYERDKLAPLGFRLDFAGDVAVSQAMIPAIVQNQVSSVVLAPLSCLLVISLLYGSLATGLLAVLPASLAVVWVLGAMGWGGMPLGVASSMFCAITLGIAVDYAIHFLERYRALRAAGTADPVLGALQETGPPIASDVAAISLGFGILALSQVPANARLGLLVPAALITGCALTLAGLGALLMLQRKGSWAARH